MNRMRFRLPALGLAVVMGASTAVPAAAAPFAPMSDQAGLVVQTQGVDLRREAERDNPGFRVRRGERNPFYRDRGHHYYNGHRGHRNRRPGYRYHNGFWFPPAAFIAGAIIGSQIARPDRAERYDDDELSPAHVEWCYSRYRSYREWDNSYQPYEGPRRECYSPYS